jgi:murein DD-endopeptidase MepM/ murein hydrolase activator NlpD
MFGGVYAILAGVLWLSPARVTADDAPEPRGPTYEEQHARRPLRYFLNHENATHFCEPLRTAFEDAATTDRVVGGKRIRQHPNGGFNVAMDVGGRSLLHTGSDIGWFREGDPVFAIADGVVRTSAPGMRVQLAERGIRMAIRGPADYGNVIIIEHQVDDRSYVSLYGHLSDERLVRQGDVVIAGQQIGSIGRNDARVNGGYDPHLHFAVSDGPCVRAGAEVVKLAVNGEPVRVMLSGLEETRMRVDLSRDLPRLTLQFGEETKATLDREGEECFLPAWLAWDMPSRARSEGYTNNIEGFHDPIAFVREHLFSGKQAPPFYVSAYGPLDLPHAVGRPATPWPVDEWANVNEQEAPTLERLSGRVICLFGLQYLCKGSRTHGFPALAALARHYAGSADVEVIALQTTLSNPSRNNLINFRNACDNARLSIPIGHMRGAPREFLTAYGQRGTPWVTIIDRDGIVQFSNYCIRPEQIIRRIDDLTRSARENDETLPAESPAR